MKIKTEAYDVYGAPLPEQEYEAVSSFVCSMTKDDKNPPFPEPVVLGLWTKLESTTRALPIYLTQKQVDKLKAAQVK